MRKSDTVLLHVVNPSGDGQGSQLPERKNRASRRTKGSGSRSASRGKSPQHTPPNPMKKVSTSDVKDIYIEGGGVVGGTVLGEMAGAFAQGLVPDSPLAGKLLSVAAPGIGAVVTIKYAPKQKLVRSIGIGMAAASANNLVGVIRDLVTKKEADDAGVAGIRRLPAAQRAPIQIARRTPSVRDDVQAIYQIAR